MFKLNLNRISNFLLCNRSSTSGAPSQDPAAQSTAGSGDRRAPAGLGPRRQSSSAGAIGPRAAAPRRSGEPTGAAISWHQNPHYKKEDQSDAAKDWQKEDQSDAAKDWRNGTPRHRWQAPASADGGRSTGFLRPMESQESQESLDSSLVPSSPTSSSESNTSSHTGDMPELRMPTLNAEPTPGLPRFPRGFKPDLPTISEGDQQRTLSSTAGETSVMSHRDEATDTAFSVHTNPFYKPSSGSAPPREHDATSGSDSSGSVEFGMFNHDGVLDPEELMNASTSSAVNGKQ